MKRIIVLMLLIMSGTALSQSLFVSDIDTTQFPIMKVKFWAFDASGNQIKNLTESDIEVIENITKKRVVTNVSCPPNKPSQKVSIAMSLDVSSSMGDRSYLTEVPLELGKTTARELCNLTDMPPSEFALQICDQNPMIIQDFTVNKNQILSAISPIQIRDGNDFEEHLLNQLAGLLNVAKTGKNKRVAVLYTDAWWYALTPNALQRCKDTCAKYDIRFYAVIYTRSESQPNGIIKSLKDLANATGGMVFDGIIASNAAKTISYQIRNMAQGQEPCTLEWRSEFGCQAGFTNVEIKLIPQNLTANTEYKIPNTAIAELEFNPSNSQFKNSIPGVKTEQKVTVTARNVNCNINNISSTNPHFDINPKSFSLNAGQSKELTISHTPVDSAYEFTKFDFINDNCATNHYASGGWRGVKLENPTLKVTSPNGDESFLVGTDTLITWEGISASDTVNIEYSIDNGKKWNLITNKASGLSYKWNSIPNPASSQCLIRISHGSYTKISEIEWENSYGEIGRDEANSIIQTKDGGYIVAGSIRINGGFSSFWVAKLFSNGKLDWQKSFDPDAINSANSIIQTSDGGYVVAGLSWSSNINNNFQIVKLSSTGKVVWKKKLGDPEKCRINSIIQTTDGGYIVAGWIFSTNGSTDYWIAKLFEDGEIAWEKSYGGTSTDQANSIRQTSDGGYIVAGYAYSMDGDVHNNHKGADYWIIKLFPNGAIDWEKSLGGSGYDVATSIIQTSDGQYVVAGWAVSNDGDISEDHGYNADYWVVKLFPDGSIDWEKSLGGSRDDHAFSVVESSDGEYVIAGYSESGNRDVSESRGSSDYWVVKLFPDGTMDWEKSLGGRIDDEANCIINSSDGGYVIAGKSNSKDMDVSVNHGDYDSWIVKLSPDGGLIQEDKSDAVFSIVSPELKASDINMKQCFVNTAKDSLVTNFIHNAGSYKCRVDSIYFKGADKDAFSITSGLPKYEVSVGATKAAEFRFKPTRVGVHTAQIVIITQADTLILNIFGEGIQPMLEVVNNIIDFGKVSVGEPRDSIQALTIKNIGSSALSITSTTYYLTDNNSFSTISGGGGFDIAAGETHKMDLRFLPTDLGRTHNILEFNYNGPGSPAKIFLSGEGLVPEIDIVNSEIDFGKVLLGSDSIIHKVITIANTGIVKLKIKDVKINNLEFERLSGSTAFDLLPGDTLKYDLKFTPSQVGPATGYLAISHNQANSPTKIKMIGVGIAPKIEVVNSEIDFGKVLLGSDSTIHKAITIANTGTAKLKITDVKITNSEFTRLSGLTALDLLPGDTLKYDLKFTPSQVGLAAADLEIYHNQANSPTKVKMIGKGIAPKIEVINSEIDFGKVLLGSDSTIHKAITIANTGTAKLNITDVKITNPEFTRLSGLTAFDLLAGDTLKYDLKFTPSQLAPVTADLEIYHNQANSPTKVKLIGEGYEFVGTASATLQALNISANAGEIVEMPIILKNQSNLEVAKITSLKVDVSFNPTLLYPLDYPVQTIDQNTSKITIENIPTNIAIGQPLIKVKFKAALGNAEKCDLALSNAEVVGGNAEINYLPGQFSLLGVCHEGGTRLVNPNANIGIRSITPNPAKDKITIKAKITEMGTKIRLIDIAGKVIKEIDCIVDKAKVQEFTIDLTNVPAGMYFIEFKSANYSQVEKVVVEK